MPGWPLILVSTAAIACTLGFAVLVLRARRRFEHRMRLLELIAVAVRRQLPLPALFGKAAAEGAMRRPLEQVAEKLSAGERLASTLAELMPRRFPPHVVATIAAAEGKHSFERTIDGLSRESGRSLNALHRISMAVIYPATLALVCLASLGVMRGFVTFLYRLSHASGETSINASVLVSVAVLVAALGFAVVLAVQIDGRYWRRGYGLFQRLGTRLPWARDAGTLIAGERCLRVVGELVGSGVLLSDALRQAAPAGKPLEAGFRAAAAAVSGGAPAEEAWAATGLPAWVVSSCVSASGSPPERFRERMEAIADRCVEKFEAQLSRQLRWIQPVSIAVFGALLFWTLLDLMLLFASLRETVSPW